jgi:phenylpropionate dioxygenase-like ring-hydroxylating dioxygenase large terminal subunit
MAAVAKEHGSAAVNGKKWHDQHPELGTAPVPIEPYISQEYFNLERERIFRKVWLNVGREEEIPQPGDYLVKDLPVCGASILLVRGKDGRLRAFHNVCSHRSNKLVWDRGGSCQMFACKFHGWTYGLNGQLTFVPDEESFFELKKGELGLTPVAADTWEGFIFINLDPQPRESLKDYLGEMGESLQGYPFAEYSATCYRWTTELRANWKILKDAFQEAYHVAFLHKRSIPDSFTGKNNPFSHGLDYRLYPRHRKMAVYGNMEHQPTPVEKMAFQFGSLVIRNDFSLSNLPPGVNPTRDPAWALDLNVIFPNFFVDVSEGTYFTYNMWPLAVDRTLWEVRTYYPQPKTAGQRFSQEYSKVIFRDVIMEDCSTLEQTQSVLASGAKTHFVLQDQEILIRHDHKVHEDFVGFYRQQ